MCGPVDASMTLSSHHCEDDAAEYIHKCVSTELEIMGNID